MNAFSVILQFASEGASDNFVNTFLDNRKQYSSSEESETLVRKATQRYLQHDKSPKCDIPWRECHAANPILTRLREIFYADGEVSTLSFLASFCLQFLWSKRAQFKATKSSGQNIFPTGMKRSTWDARQRKVILKSTNRNYEKRALHGATFSIFMDRNFRPDRSSVSKAISVVFLEEIEPAVSERP